MVSAPQDMGREEGWRGIGEVASREGRDTGGRRFGEARDCTDSVDGHFYLDCIAHIDRTYRVLRTFG